MEAFSTLEVVQYIGGITSVLWGDNISMAKFSFQNSATLHNRLYRAKMRIKRYETGSDKRTGLTGYKIPGFVIYPVPHLIQPIT